MRTFVHLDDSLAHLSGLRPSRGRVAECKHASATRITVTAAASQTGSSLPVWSLPWLSQHWLWVSPVTLSVTLRLNQSLFRVRVITRSWLCALHGWHVLAAPTTSRPTNVLFIMPAPWPTTSPSEALPLLYCATVQLMWKQAYLGLLGCGLDRRKMQADVGIVLAPALQVTEIARWYVSYMTSSYLSQIRFIYDSPFNLGWSHESYKFKFTLRHI